MTVRILSWNAVAAENHNNARVALISLQSRDNNDYPATSSQTSWCHLGVTVRSDLLVVHSAIDNLGKGAAGQAVQCFNLMQGLEEETGLRCTALYP